MPLEEPLPSLNSPASWVHQQDLASQSQHHKRLPLSLGLLPALWVKQGETTIHVVSENTIDHFKVWVEFRLSFYFYFFIKPTFTQRALFTNSNHEIP